MQKIKELLNKQDKDLDYLIKTDWMRRPEIRERNIKAFLCQSRKEIIETVVKELIGEAMSERKVGEKIFAYKKLKGGDMKAVRDYGIGYNDKVKEAEAKAKKILKEL